MRKTATLLVSVITIFLVLGNANNVQNPFFQSEVNVPNSYENNTRTKRHIEPVQKVLHKHRNRHHHTRPITSARCRRYADQFYSRGMPIYVVPNYQQQKYVAPPYQPPKYVQPNNVQPKYVPAYYPPNRPRYVPRKCHTYCVTCPTSSCRRRCPAPDHSKGTTHAQIIIVPTTPFPTAISSASTKGTTGSAFPTKTSPSQITACNCDVNGSKYSSCDPTTGNCICKPHYEGRTCSTCKSGYWKNTNKDCVKCHCNEFGSRDSFCDQESGQCSCHPGIGGFSCDVCLPNHYGTVDTRCIECEPCNRKGHVCGREGKCVCPDFTIGIDCERCAPNSWGYEPGIGCKACNCSATGSTNFQCDRTDGKCTCKMGYEGEKCNRCSLGYYGYPHCKQCNCDASGTHEGECLNRNCRCNKDGSCNCKENVIGNKCNTCKGGTFGLTKDNPKGCTNCFCFSRSNKCVDTRYNWDKIRHEKQIENNEPFQASADIISLPKQFTGDLTTSYDGYLSVSGTGGFFSVFLTGNGISVISEPSTNELKLNEKYWKVTYGNLMQCSLVFTRECFMLVLQNVTAIVVEGENMEIKEVLLDQAKPYIPYNRTSHTIEKCECPAEYAGLSCQNPNEGYYRHFPVYPEQTQNPWIDDVIGIAKPCDCNGRSNRCDPDTGHCRNCSNHTSGPHCELCDIGYYKDYSHSCLPCPCPSETENNAESCLPRKTGFVCNCKKGYTGTNCDTCAEGYFRDPDTGACVACNCNLHGSYSYLCDGNGKCRCKDGFEGHKCNQCRNEREYIKDGVCTPCDQCTQLLFADIDKLTAAVEDTFNLFKDGLSPPWKTLTHIMKKHDMLSKKFHDKVEKAEHILLTSNVTEYEDRVYNMEYTLDSQNKLAENNLKNADTLHNSSISLSEDVKHLQKKLKEIIDNLENFGKQHISIKDALKRAKKILREINDILEIFNSRYDDETTIKFCSKVTREVNKIYKDPSIVPRDLFEKFENRLSDIQRLTEEVESRSNLAKLKNQRNSDRIFQLKNKLGVIGRAKENNEDNMKEIMKKLKAVNETIHRVEKVYEDMRNLNFDDTYKLEDRLKRDMRKIPEIEELFLRATDHVQELEDTVEKYKSIFNFTKDEWKTIKASGAYEEIIKGIKNAREKAEEASSILENATRIIEPNDSDGIVDKTILAHAYSDRLKQRIVNLKNISNSFNKIKNKLETFRYGLLESGKANNDLTQILHNMETEITSKSDTVAKLEQAIQNSTNISEEMRQIEKEVYNINLTSRYDLFKKYETYLNLTSKEEINKLKDNLTYTRNQLDRINLSSTYFEDIKKFNGGNRQLNLESIREKIKDLQNKVRYAKQAADSINVAMGLTNCSMYYNLPQSEIFRSLSVTYKCSHCRLFKWENSQGNFISLKIKNNRAVLEVENNLTEHKIPNDIETEQTIFIEKIGAWMLIKFEKDAKWVKAQNVNKLLVIDSSDLMQVGGESLSQNTPYVYKIKLNDNNIGLWKFVKTEGHCKGQARVSTKDPEGARPFYNGNGYRVYSASPLSPAKFNLRFDFATFDENSLLYLAQEKDNLCAYIALFLQNGRLTFDVTHNNGKRVTLTTTKRYNDGKNYYADLAMTYANRNQKYSLQTDHTIVQTDERLDSRDVFKIKRANHFIGGVAPTFNGSCIEVKQGSFLGLLQHSTKLTNEVVSYGVVQQKGELELNKAWFTGEGYLKLSSPIEPIKINTPPKFEKLSFIFRPLKSNGAIMNVTQFGIISLSNKKLRIDFKKEATPSYFIGSKVFTANDYNVVEIELRKDKVTVDVNGDKEEIAYNHKHKQDRVEVTLGAAENYEGYRGGISDLIVNDQRLMFNSKTVTDFQNVGIGREDPLIRKRVILKGLVFPANVTNTMQNTEGCATTANYVTDPTAVKFGDKPNSYIHLKTSFWKKDFKLYFEFRTFYPDGVLFISTGSTQQQHFTFLELKEGRFYLHVRGKRKVMKNLPITFPNKLNDGRWHTVQITKKNRKIFVILDGERKKPVRVPKNALRNEILLGGVPEGYTNFKELKERLHPFRGCMKSLSVNDELKFLVKNNKDILYKNIRQCFPSIEEGAYFGGDAFAIYKQNFRVTKLLELAFEFRTAEQNGVLLSVSNPRNQPALSVELQNGAVVMKIDVGSGVTANVTNNLDSDFALCDNRWHNVTAMYSSSEFSELTVNVDGVRKSWVVDANSLMEEIDAPLYIGGLPDNAPVGTLKIRENFKGCIKKLKIEDKLMDWSDMEELNNVLLNSCPVVPANNT